METREKLPQMPSSSFLIERHFFKFKDFNHTVSLMEFGYYDADSKLQYIYHLLIDDYFTRVFTSFECALNYLSKFY